MSIEKFLEALKQDDVLGAFSIIKEELSGRARLVVEETQFQVAEGFGLARIQEKEEEEEKDDDKKKKDEDDSMTEEEKERKRAEEKENEGK